MNPLACIQKSQLNAQPNGQVTVSYPAGASTVLSIQQDGSIQTRPQGTAGAFELASISGNSLVYAPSGTTGEAFMVPYAGV
jgi:hypothetical protein